MTTLRKFLAAGSAALVLATAHAQQTGPHIGYVYPAGGKAGTTFEVVIGGQFLFGATNVFVSGGGVQAQITHLLRPLNGKELNDARILVDQLMARRAVVRNDFKALEAFRSFKNTKSLKPDPAEEAKGLETLKKKYAHATWTPEDEKLLAEARKKIAGGVRRPENPAISEIATLTVTIAADATQGDHEIRLGTPQGLTNPLLFKIGQLPEVTRPAIKAIKQQTSVKEKQMSVPLFKVAKDREETKVTLPTVVNGQIMPGTVDYFRFPATKGTKLVIAVSARELIPYLADAVPGWFQATIALYDASGKELAYDDDFRFSPDPVLYYEIPADGEYVLEIKDSIYRGREDFVYRITLGEIPFITSIYPLGGPVGATAAVELKGWNLPTTRVNVDNQKRAPGTFPIFVRKDPWISNFVPFAVDSLPECAEQKVNSQRRTAQAVKLPIIVNGRIEKPDDRDYFKFEGQAGQALVAEVLARHLNSPLDALIKLTDADGKLIATNDDCEDKGAGLETHHADSYLRLTLPTNGTYCLEVTDTSHQGGPDYAYRLRLSAPRPDFALRVVPSSINMRYGGTVPLTVYAVRRDGFTNAIPISLQDAPDGFKVNGSAIPAGQDSVKLTLTAPPMGSPHALQLNFVGRATIEGQQVAHSAIPAEDMMQAFAYRHLVLSQEMRIGIGGRSSSKGGSGKGSSSKSSSSKIPPLKIISDLPVKIPAGGSVSIKLSVPGYMVTSGKVALELTEPPEGISIQKFVPATSGAELFIAADTAKCKAGQKGNLIVAVMAKNPSSSPKNKTPKKGAQIATLPAIPFEIVEP
jgi:hypothetical protein